MSTIEKHSPESSSRSSAGDFSTQSTPGSLRGAAAQGIGLVVRKQPPTHAFSQEWFDVEFGLDFARAASSTHARTGDTDSEFIATLHHYKSGRPVIDGPQLFFEPHSIWFSLRGSPPRRKQRVRCSIKHNQIRRDKAEAYCIRLSPKVQDGPLSRELSQVNTACINLVNHKIRVDTDEEWENIWYKDEGGRDKCMTVVASLYDKDNRLYTGEQIPLQVALYYANDELPVKVMKQDTMRTIGAAKQSIDLSSGKCTLRFRIEDVSKNHQGQDFTLKVSTDTKVKGFKDIAPGFSPAVSVRSKRNKRHRASNSRGQDQRLSSPTVARTIYEDLRGESNFAAADIPRLREALKGVIHWTEEVVNGLVTLQWQVIGYHQGPDGSPDYNRPYHNIPNPDAVMSRILGMYSDTTREQLMLILRAVDRNAGGPQDPDPYGGMIQPPPIPRGEGDENFHMAHRGIPMQSLGGGRPPPLPYAAGIHPVVAPDAFREKPEPGLASIQQQQQQQQQPQQHMHFPPSHMAMRTPYPPAHLHPMSANRGQRSVMTAGPSMHSHIQVPIMHPMGGGSPPRQQQQQHHHPSPLPTNRESEVAYVLAKQYKSMRTGERLGFPAYTPNKELLGFYRESNLKVGVGQFIPVARHREDFGPLEIMQATEILQVAIENKSEAVHALKDWGSMANLLDHALVYDWSKDITGAGGPSGSGSEPSD